MTAPLRLGLGEAPPEPGVYDDVPNQTYHTWDACSHSRLAHLRGATVTHMAHHILNPKEADYFDLGNLVDLGRYRELHLNGAHAAIVASGSSPRLVGHPDGTVIKAVGKVKGGKLYYQKDAVNARIENIVIDGNQRAWDSPRGMWIDGGHGTTIVNCTIKNVSHSGLTVLGGHHSLLVSGCTFADISWPDMTISAVQGVQDEFRISSSTGEVEEGWLKRPTNALMERWLTDRWTTEDAAEHGKRGYARRLFPMDVGYLHGIYLTGGQHDVLIEKCTFEDMDWGFGINITGGIV